MKWYCRCVLLKTQILHRTGPLYVVYVGRDVGRDVGRNVSHELASLALRFPSVQMDIYRNARSGGYSHSLSLFCELLFLLFLFRLQAFFLPFSCKLFGHARHASSPPPPETSPRLSIITLFASPISRRKPYLGSPPGPGHALHGVYAGPSPMTHHNVTSSSCHLPCRHDGMSGDSPSPSSTAYLEYQRINPSSAYITLPNFYLLGSRILYRSTQQKCHVINPSPAT